MKKIWAMIMLFILGIILVSCDSKKPEKEQPIDPTPDDTEEILDLPETEENVGFAIHYDQKSMNGSKYKWNIWLWEKNKDGADVEFNAEDKYGIVARYKWSEFSTTAYQSGVGFIIKENKPWSESPAKDIDSDRFINFTVLERDKYGYYNVYLKYNDETIYTSASGDVSEMIEDFGLAYNKKAGYQIWFKTNKPYSDFEITLEDQIVFDNNTEDELLEKTDTRVIISLGHELPDILKNYHLKVTFKESNKSMEMIADNSILYSTTQFNEKYTYNGELGAIYSAEQTTFRVWSPVSTEITLRIYDTGTPASLGGNNTFTAYPMKKGSQGTWEYTLAGDCAGKYYTYVVSNSTYTKEEVVDPYAKSTGINGLRGMIVDFSKTNPVGWENISAHSYKPTELTVYETHIADLTSSTTWKGTKENAKLYKGFYEEGTYYTQNGITVKTGFDHIKELGVNAVQILPFFDQANDERSKVFNWGYNPLNYNSLEGIYSSNPYDGYTKIKEFKELVQAYNKAGINIIMDVVYNHVNGLEKSNFDILMPKYYFRYNADGPSNGSGCGNETASDMPMFRKFMIDSTEFWASEYKLGGFRFDLMGIHDVETMNQLTKNLKDNVNSDIVVYGEPWAGGTTAMPNGSTAAVQASMNKFEGYGCFNDKMRDALIKGGLNAVTSKGWITNTKKVSSADVKDIEAGLKGLVLSTNSVLEPEKCINYVTCHDNYTLNDRINAAGITDTDTVKKMAMLSNSMVFTSQGVSFMLAGEEFLRTKMGNSNSYNSSYKVNELDYSLKVKNLQFFRNYQKLIELKQNSNLFGKTGAECKELVINKNTDGSLIYYDVIDHGNNVCYRIAHSNGVASDSKTVDFNGFTLYLDTLNQTNLVLNSTTNLSDYQTIIAYQSLA
ncbi:MAG: type I pullulanase [Anaeroplasmataceae bacterium]|nr:type I pullulanase [Anaeroplasmataceae bacterium]